MLNADFKNQYPVNASPRVKRWMHLLDDALRHLDDRSSLNSNPLARIKRVKTVAVIKYSQNVLPNGLALKYLILKSIADLNKDLAGDQRFSRALKFLELCVQGLSRREVSTKLALNREYVCRKIRPQALELLTRTFIRISRQPSNVT